MQARKWNVLALLTAVVVGLGACGGNEAADDEGTAGEAPAAQTPGPVAQQPQQEVALAEGVTRAQFDQGRQLFTGQGGCHACHGPDATGTQLAPDLTDGEWLNVSDPSVDNIVTLIKTGVPQPVEHPAPMQPMGGANLTDEQVRALAGYVLSIAGA